MFPHQYVRQYDTPQSLKDLCFKCIASHLDTICSKNPETELLSLKDGVTIPSYICEKLLEVYQQSGGIVTDGFVNIFEDVQTTHLKRVQLANANLTDSGVRILLKHKPSELDLGNCMLLTKQSLDLIDEFGERLLSLVIGPSANIRHDTAIPVSIEMVEEFSRYFRRGYIIRAPNLRRLALKDLSFQGDIWFLRLLVQPLLNLTHLELSVCHNVGDLSYLCDLSNLTSLVLYDVPQLQSNIGCLCLLKQLRRLDISQSHRMLGTYVNGSQTLSSLVESLPMLSWLDISGTNLAGVGCLRSRETDYCPYHGIQSNVSCKTARSDIPGLESRVDNPLDFLGLYCTQNGACFREKIPARKITGTANEEQILNAVATYSDRPLILRHVLYDLCHTFRRTKWQNVNRAVNVVLEAMDRNRNLKHIQLSVSTYICNLTKDMYMPLFSPATRRRIVSSLTNVMSRHQGDERLTELGLLTICNLIPDELYDYERLVPVVLRAFQLVGRDGCLELYGVLILKLMAWKVDARRKQLLGDMGVMTGVMELIERKLVNKVYDSVMQLSWATLKNITDQVDTNCRRFMDGGGMRLFLRCYRRHGDDTIRLDENYCRYLLQLLVCGADRSKSLHRRDSLVNGMMGVMRQVAEVTDLRPLLRNNHCVSIFTGLLVFGNPGSEVNCYASAVLTLLASDGPNVWLANQPRREMVLQKMIIAMESWDLGMDRKIEYESFKSFMRLLQAYHTPECQHWAVWTMANLTRVNPAKYCPLVYAERGVMLLQELIANEGPYRRIKKLAAIVIEQCQMYQGNLGGAHASTICGESVNVEEDFNVLYDVL